MILIHVRRVALVALFLITICKYRFRKSFGKSVKNKAKSFLESQSFFLNNIKIYLIFVIFFFGCLTKKII